MNLASPQPVLDHVEEFESTSMRVPLRVAVVTPVFNDWASFALLLRRMNEAFEESDVQLSIIAIDDGSMETWDWEGVAGIAGGPIVSIEVIRLGLNLGHQRAIAVGLVEVAVRNEFETVLVMDCDGEDRPVDAASLVRERSKNSESVLLAHRAERSEGETFKIWYYCYKLLFWLLTGRRISFGNFSLLPHSATRRLARMPELWNNLPAAIMRSRLPYRMLPTSRGQRYAGKSKMALVSLVTHGLSAMSVYTDVIFVRVLIAAGAVAASTILGMAITIFIRIATQLAIPGWTTTAVGVLVIVLLQAVILVAAALFLLLANRSARPIIPLTDCEIFIESRTRRDFDMGSAVAAP